MTDYFGRYKGLINSLISYSNAKIRYRTTANGNLVDIGITEWLILGAIIEAENNNPKVTDIAGILDLPKGTVSKALKSLSSLGYVERYRYNENHKIVLVKPTNDGKQFYQKFTEETIQPLYKPILDALSALPDEQVNQITKAFWNFGKKSQ